jgi:hypothetical protein
LKVPPTRSQNRSIFQNNKLDQKEYNKRRSS